jgi:hypothetical protein
MTGKKENEEFRRDVLFVNCLLVLAENMMVYFSHKPMYEVWLEGDRWQVVR